MEMGRPSSPGRSPMARDVQRAPPVAGMAQRRAPAARGSGDRRLPVPVHGRAQQSCSSVSSPSTHRRVGCSLGRPRPPGTTQAQDASVAGCTPSRRGHAPPTAGRPLRSAQKVPRPGAFHPHGTGGLTSLDRVQGHAMEPRKGDAPRSQKLWMVCESSSVILRGRRSLRRRRRFVTRLRGTRGRTHVVAVLSIWMVALAGCSKLGPELSPVWRS